MGLTLIYHLAYAKQFLKELQTIPVETREILKRKLEQLASGDYPFNLAPLKGPRYQGIYRIRVSSWRVFCRLDQPNLTIYVLSVKHRREAYRN